MQWPGVDADGDEGALLAPAFQGHCGDPGGGQPPLSMVPPVWHDGDMEGPEWDAQAHVTVNLGSGAEETTIISRGGEGGHRQGFQRLWAPPGDGDFLQMPRVGDLGDGRRLAGGGKELGPVKYRVE